MKKVLLASLLAAAVWPAFAGNTASLGVSAVVSGTCKIQSGGTNIDFGTIDPSGTGSVTANGSLSYKCTNGTAPTSFTANNGANASGTQKRMASGGNFLNYAISFTAPTTAGNGFGSGSTATSVTITGTVVQTDYANAASGTYSDTVDFTIAP